jgi:DNA-directed RNA polymerase omega subunit
MPEELGANIDSAYRLVIVSARRAKELMRGAVPRVESQAHKYTTVAIQEVREGTIEFEIFDPKAPNSASE